MRIEKWRSRRNNLWGFYSGPNSQIFPYVWSSFFLFSLSNWQPPQSELSTAFQLTSNEPREKILIRVKNAWINLFAVNPEVAVGQRVPEDDETKTILTYSLFKNEAEGQKWLDSTLLVVEDNYDDLFQRNMDTSSDVPERKARLEISFEPGAFNLCFHFSHVVVEAMAAMICLNNIVSWDQGANEACHRLGLNASTLFLTRIGRWDRQRNWQESRDRKINLEGTYFRRDSQLSPSQYRLCSRTPIQARWRRGRQRYRSLEWSSGNSSES